jgi:hypothetical protein
MDEAYLLFLESLTAMDFKTARLEWGRFRQILARHMALEEDTLIPRYAALGDPPKSGKPEHFSGDHTILVRACDKVLPLLESIAAQENVRRSLVENLDPLIRVGRILEHHDQRETDHFYPRLQANMDPAEAKELASTIRQALRAGT